MERRLTAIIVGIGTLLLLSCHIPGKEAPSFENCPSFPKSWSFVEFGDAGDQNLLVLDDARKPVVVRSYTEDDQAYLEIVRLEDDELETSRTELEQEPIHLQAVYHEDKVHMAMSTEDDEGSPIRYCHTDGESWSCEDTGYEGEPRIFVDRRARLAMLVLSGDELRYIAKDKDGWKSEGAADLPQVATSWAFSAESEPLVAAVADENCDLMWLEFDGSWSERGIERNLCSISFAGLDFYGAPLVAGTVDTEPPSTAYVLKETVEGGSWAKVSMGEPVDQLFASYPSGCDRVFMFYRRNRNLRRRIVEIKPYDLGRGEERGIELPDDYELERIVGVAQDTKRKPHLLLIVKPEDGEDRLLLYAKPK